MRNLPVLTLLIIAAMLAASQGALSWHLEDEKENEQWGPVAGDPRVLEDTAECREDAAGLQDVVCTPYYVHFYGNSDRVMNKQRPPDCAPEMSRGASMPGLWGGVSKDNVWLHAWGVMYDMEDGDHCVPWHHIHADSYVRGDVRLSRDVNVTLYWYLSHDQTDPHHYQVDPPGPPLGAMPCVTVHARLEPDRGRTDPLAVGTVTKTFVTGPEDPGLGLEDPCPGAQGEIEVEEITQFKIDLGTATGDIPAGWGLRLNVDWYQWDPDATDEVGFIQSHWKAHTSPDRPARLILPLEDEALHVEAFEVKSSGDGFLVNASINTTWGLYDLDTKNIRLVLENGQGEQVPLNHVEGPTINYPSRWGDTRGLVNVTYEWDAQQEGLEPGEYTLRMAIPDWQHLYEVNVETTFVYSQSEVEAAPLLPGVVPAAFFILALVALVRRQRTRNP